MMFKKIFKSLDYSVLAICITLFVIGLVALFSANGGFEGNFAETQKQLIWFLVGFILMIIIILVDYEIIGKLWIAVFRRIYSIINCSSFYRTNKWCD